jgi:signal transduction histidine kinase
MSRSWLELTVLSVAVVAGALAFGITLTSHHEDLPALQAVLVVFTGWSFIGAGLIARARQPQNRTGLLLIAIGFWWLVAALYASNRSLVFTIGLLISAVPAAFLVHLLVAYPNGRLESRWERVLVATGYGLTTLIANLPFLLVDRRPISGCDECPGNAFLVRDSHSVTTVFTVLFETTAVVFLLAVVATLLRRWHRSSPAARRTLTPVLTAGATTLLLFGVSVFTQDFVPTVARVVGWAATLAFSAIPYLFLWGLLRSRLARADIGRALADGSVKGLPREIQASIRRLLHDPTAELLISCERPEWGYTDVEGTRRDVEAVDGGRAVVPIELEGRRLAAIVHDEALLEEPALVEEVAAAVALEVARDKALFDLQASERRGRALLAALPDKMFRLSGDGVVLDIQENPNSGWSAPPARVHVGSSAYDAPVPREIIDRVMAAGRRALETAQLQTLEWEIDLDGEQRYTEGRFIPSGDNEFIVVVRDVGDRRRQEVERAALHRVALAVASEAKAEEIFDLVAKEVGGVLGAHAVRLVRFEPGGTEAVIVGGWHEPDVPVLPVGRRYPMEGSASEAVYRTGRAVRRQRGAANVSRELAEQMERLDVNSLVAAPITVSGCTWGVVVTTLTAPHSFPPGTEERLEEFTQLVSLALANEESRTQLAASRVRLVSAGDEERRRLERNLHDGAQQRLVSLALSLRHARGRLVSDPGETGALLSAASAELDVALEELRELARGIHPAVLTNRGLAPALESLADRAPLPVELELELPTGRRLPEAVEAAAYYLVSEALANIAKHANACCAVVRVASDNGSAVVEIADDGVGGADPHGGSGLRGLTDRIEALDGTLDVFSPPGGGTRIRAEIPCD